MRQIDLEATSQKCIWMSAGIISYKLCDRQFDCEHCEFDHVIRGIVPDGDDPVQINSTYSRPKSGSGRTEIRQLVDRYLYSLLSDCRINLNRFYHPNHLWLQPENENVVRIGINKLIYKIMEPLEKILLPSANSVYQRNQLLAWLVHDNHTYAIHSPVQGKVIEVNAHGTAADLIAADQFLFKMSGIGIGASVQQLCGNLRGLEYFINTLEPVRMELANSFDRHIPAGIGPTLADGGDPQVNLRKVLGTKTFDRLIDILFRNK